MLARQMLLFIKTLKQGDHQIAEMRYVEGLEPSAIAERLGRNVVTVRTSLWRTHRKMSRHLGITAESQALIPRRRRHDCLPYRQCSCSCTHRGPLLRGEGGGLGRRHKETIADDALRKLYGQYWAEVQTLTQIRMLEAPAGEEWLAGIRTEASAADAKEPSAEPVRHSPRSALSRCVLRLVGIASVAISPIVLAFARWSSNVMTREAEPRPTRAPLRQRSRRRWAVAGGVAAGWVALEVMTGSAVSATAALVVITGLGVAALSGLRALGITRDHPWMQRIASRPWRDGQDVLRVAIRHLPDVFLFTPSGSLLAPNVVELQLNPDDLASLCERMELGVIILSLTEVYEEQVAGYQARLARPCRAQVYVTASGSVPPGRYRLRQGHPVGRHPARPCPTRQRRARVPTPQTGGLIGCLAFSTAGLPSTAGRR